MSEPVICAWCHKPILESESKVVLDYGRQTMHARCFEKLARSKTLRQEHLRQAAQK